MSNPIVAIDDGYAQTKVYGMSPNGGDPVHKVFRTSVRSGRYGLQSIGGDGPQGAYRTEEGEEFTVSDLIESESTQFDSFHTSRMNRVLIAHALLNSGYSGRDIDLIAGLPVGDFFRADGTRDAEKIQAKTENLKKGIVRIAGKEPLAGFKTIDIGCQAVAAWVDYMIGDDLEFRRDATGRVAIVDIGGRTTDIAVVVNESANPVIDHSKSGTQNIGVLDVYRTLEALIRAEFGIKDAFPLAELDATVRSGTLTLFGQKQDVAELIKKAIKEIDREVERRLGSGANLQAVVFVGGGGALFKACCQRIRNSQMRGGCSSSAP